MKRIGYIYEKIYDIENIKTAIIRASEKKRHYHYVQEILSNIDHYALAVHYMLINKTFIPCVPKIKTIQDASSGHLVLGLDKENGQLLLLSQIHEACCINTAS